MEIIDINNCLISEHLFDLFKAQLKKDFEGAGLDAAFTDNLPDQFDPLKKSIVLELEQLVQRHAAQLSRLLYRVDISEKQLRMGAGSDHTSVFEEKLAELIIKRVLQKVILKKKFSG